jgi:hypothetical protein
MPYIVIGGSDIVSYRLKYLELTTASADGKVFGAYAVKAVAFDNKMENLAKQPNLTFKMPAEGQLTIEHGKIRFGDKLITPNYDLTGKMP